GLVGPPGGGCTCRPCCPRRWRVRPPPPGSPGPAEGGGEWVLSLVERPRFQGRPAVTLDEDAALVLHLCLCGTGAKRPLADRFQVGLAAQVDGEGQDLEVALLREPPHSHGRIKSS